MYDNVHTGRDTGSRDQFHIVLCTHSHVEITDRFIFSGFRDPPAV